ncbi:serine acetyltransferase 1, chloroplastic [Morus notabilis]|uniref:serine acetyltransferase 1, chloroplastic n=1 Tax=Morus notabilis TaxID=981085 RepID=UPI000CED1EFA|nr:serine acetyltransferase 1, chloroplastic [Morus notabilis]
MKILTIITPPLYKIKKSPFPQTPTQVISLHTNPPTFSPIFSLPKHHHIHQYSSMATCIDVSRTAAGPQPPHPLSRDPNRLQTADDAAQLKFLKICRRRFSDRVPCAASATVCQNRTATIHTRRAVDFVCDDDNEIEDFDDDYGDGDRESELDLWMIMKSEARSDIDEEPILSAYYFNSILSYNSLESALANHLSVKLSNHSLQTNTLFDIFIGVLSEDEEIMKSVTHDLKAVKERDPACISYVHCFLNFKGFLACQAHRVAHKLWSQGRKVLALLIQNRVSEAFGVDIHPGARIGRGILLDHATGVVVGETAVIGDNVSILHNVTLGGTGKACGDRHPKIGDGVLIGAGTCILGNIRIGEGAKIGAGSVVLKEVPPRTTAVGNPAKLVGGKENPIKLDKIPSLTMDHTSYISEWSDYVI